MKIVTDWSVTIVHFIYKERKANMAITQSEYLSHDDVSFFGGNIISYLHHAEEYDDVLIIPSRKPGLSDYDAVVMYYE